MTMTTQTDRYPFSDRYLEVAGHSIYCVETGSGDPVLFLHGNPPEHCPITSDGMQYYLNSVPTIRSRRAQLAFVRVNPLHGKPRASVQFIEEIRDRLPELKVPVTWLMPSPGVIVSEDYPPSQAQIRAVQGVDARPRSKKLRLRPPFSIRGEPAARRRTSYFDLKK
jgi:hypothetical protein